MTVADMEVWTLAALTVPWRIRFRLRAGTITIDGTSSEHPEPAAWNRSETLSVLTAALLGRFLGRALGRVEGWAAARRKGPGDRKPTVMEWVEVSDLSGSGPEAWWPGTEHKPARGGLAPWAFVVRGDETTIVRPTVGRAVRLLRGEIVGAWAGEEAKVVGPEPKVRKPRKRKERKS